FFLAKIHLFAKNILQKFNSINEGFPKNFTIQFLVKFIGLVCLTLIELFGVEKYLGRRKRKKVVYRRVRTLPKIFTCPKCGHKTVKAKKVKDNADKIEVICGHCGVSQIVDKNEITEPVDAFGDFIDIYYKDQEYARLTRREEKLWEKKQFTELTLVYSFLADNANVNAKRALEEYEKNKDPEDLKQAEMWKATAQKYVENEKRLREQLDSGIIQDAEIENIYEEAEDNPFDEGEAKKSEKPKRRANIEEILGDTGFLEF
ncbi:MAG: hypothetical protein ACTSXK_00625, partial [Promethearchaeota archaeon]